MSLKILLLLLPLFTTGCVLLPPLPEFEEGRRLEVEVITPSSTQSTTTANTLLAPTETNIPFESTPVPTAQSGIVDITNDGANLNFLEQIDNFNRCGQSSSFTGRIQFDRSSPILGEALILTGNVSTSSRIEITEAIQGYYQNQVERFKQQGSSSQIEILANSNQSVTSNWQEVRVSGRVTFRETDSQSIKTIDYEYRLGIVLNSFTTEVLTCSPTSTPTGTLNSLLSNTHTPVLTPTSALAFTPTATPVPTHTSTATPVPTPTPTATPVPTPTPTAIPTFTLVPTFTSTPTDVPLNVDTLSTPQLLFPPEDAICAGTRVEFKWMWDGELQENLGFEIRGSKSGEAFEGLHNAQTTFGMTPNSQGIYSLGFNIPNEYANTSMRWTVAIVILNPYGLTGIEAVPQDLSIGATPGGTIPNISCNPSR